jgi:hypothetical protein
LIPQRGGELSFLIGWSKASNVVGLWSLLALDYVVLDAVSLFEGLIAVCEDCAVMNEDVRTTFSAEKAVSLCIIEPANRALIV